MKTFSSASPIGTPPVFLMVVAVSFSMLIGVLWEFFEFGVDRIWKKDMQKDTWVSEISTVSLDTGSDSRVTTISPIEKVTINDGEAVFNGYLDIGLYDTMEDLFVTFVGAVSFNLFVAIYSKRHKGFISYFLIDTQEHTKKEWRSTMKKRVITISREFGSGGHGIGKTVAETLGIAFYDQKLLEKIAEETGFSKEFIEEAAEDSTAKNSLLFNLVMNRSLHGRTEPSPADTIYFAQTKIIKSLAEKESCVIVGRCSDYILRDNSDCLHVFIYSDTEDRAKRILERYGKSEKPIQKRIADKDARRKIYYTHYTDRPWGIPQNYDLCLNSGVLGEEVCVNTVLNIFNS